MPQERDSVGQRYVDHAGGLFARDSQPAPAPPQPDPQPTPLTAEEFNQIKSRTARLFALYNLCAARKLYWNTDHREVCDLMMHIDNNFPGNDLLMLLAEVERLKGLSGIPSPRAVTQQLPQRGRRAEDTPPPYVSEAYGQGLLNTPPHKRTRSDVLYLKHHLGIYGGCCDSYANHSGCDCLERALPD
jgi:hypothetical protein